MATIAMISEEEAKGKVKKIYDEIMERLGIDFVPNLYKVMAHNPEYLEDKKSAVLPWPSFILISILILLC